MNRFQISAFSCSLFYGHATQGVRDPQHGIIAAADVSHSQTRRNRLTRSEGIEHVTVTIIIAAAAGFERDVPDVGLVQLVQEPFHGVTASSLRPVIGVAFPDDHDMLQREQGNEFRYLTSPFVAFISPVHLLLPLQAEAGNLLPQGGKVRRLANGCGKNVGARVPGSV